LMVELEELESELELELEPQPARPRPAATTPDASRNSRLDMLLMTDM